MKRSDQDRLLSEILKDGDAGNLRAASLARGLDFLRRRRRRARLAQGGGAALLAGLVILGLVAHRGVAPQPAPPVVGAATPPAAETGKVKIITDEELFALFPNRAVALIGAPGHQQLVFLNNGVASEQP
jgi:hypothetical protein